MRITNSAINSLPSEFIAHAISEGEQNSDDAFDKSQAGFSKSDRTIVFRSEETAPSVRMVITDPLYPKGFIGSLFFAYGSQEDAHSLGTAQYYLICNKADEYESTDFTFYK